MARLGALIVVLVALLVPAVQGRGRLRVERLIDAGASQKLRGGFDSANAITKSEGFQKGTGKSSENSVGNGFGTDDAYGALVTGDGVAISSSDGGGRGIALGGSTGGGGGTIRDISAGGGGSSYSLGLLNGLGFGKGKGSGKGDIAPDGTGYLTGTGVATSTSLGRGGIASGGALGVGGGTIGTNTGVGGGATVDTGALGNGVGNAQAVGEGVLDLYDGVQIAEGTGAATGIAVGNGGAAKGAGLGAGGAANEKVQALGGGGGSGKAIGSGNAVGAGVGDGIAIAVEGEGAAAKGVSESVAVVDAGKDGLGGGESTAHGSGKGVVTDAVEADTQTDASVKVTPDGKRSSQTHGTATAKHTPGPGGKSIARASGKSVSHDQGSKAIVKAEADSVRGD